MFNIKCAYNFATLDSRRYSYPNKLYSHFSMTESCQALKTAGKFISMLNTSAGSARQQNEGNKTFDSAYLITGEPGHVVWLNFKLLQTQLASVQVH